MTNLSLLNDVVFKIAFGSEKNAPALRALLNALLGLEGEERITEVFLLNPGLDEEHLLDKGAILDVKARDNRRRLYNIEVQLLPQVAYVERALYYLAGLFGGQLEKGDSYESLARTIGISLLDFTLFPEQQDLHSQFRLYDERHGQELSDVFELHFIELTKFRQAHARELTTAFDAAGDRG